MTDEESQIIDFIIEETSKQLTESGRNYPRTQVLGFAGAIIRANFPKCLSKAIASIPLENNCCGKCQGECHENNSR